MGVSTRNHQVHPANLFKFNEIFTPDRAFFSDHFGKKQFDFLHPSSLQNTFPFFLSLQMDDRAFKVGLFE
jgi:hypothetical protein